MSHVCNGSDPVHMHPARETLAVELANIGVSEADITIADALLIRAIQERPDGHLVRTCGPISDPSDIPEATAENTLMFSWQDEEDEPYMEALWMRP